MRPVNLFLTEDGVLKLGYYGLTTQAECYPIRKKECDGVRSFAPEVFRGEYGMESDVWSFGIVLMELMGITPYSGYENNHLPTLLIFYESPFRADDIQSSELTYFLKKCFEERVSERSNVNELMNVSVVRWRMMSSIHL